jgi:hypothetical protein
MAVPVLLGLLATQGARAGVTRAIQSTALTGARASKQLASKLKKNFDKQTSRAKIPSQSKLIENLTAQEKNIIKRSGLLDDVPTRTVTIPSGAYKGGASKGLRPLNIPAQYSNKFPIPYQAAPQEALRQQAARQALYRNPMGRRLEGQDLPVNLRPNYVPGLPPTPYQKALALAGRNKLLTGAGLLGTTALTSSFMGEEAPQDTIEPVVTTPPTETQPVRFSQLLRPGYDATGKEVLNAALLRAGISLLRGEGAQGALKSAASVSESQNIYKTGSEALEAGRRALGPEAAVEVGQRSDGTFYYRGKFDPTDVLMQPTTTGKEITAEQYQAVRKKILEAKPDATEEDIKDTLAAQGLVYTGV